ncbi:hypothetical protein [Silvibacterium acidisoli]|uniref:hypothetical protein n=1 Tax=Acidobacteriaceae bacterium ZG23-2 TaxID=2883246 RepID=UPI00406C8BC2
MTEPYKEEVNAISPVAIKLDQEGVHAPEHNTWGIVVCDVCGERFALGPHRIYGSRTTEQQCVEELQAILDADHRAQRGHSSSYKLDG